MTCDAKIARVITDGPSVILDKGHTTRTVSTDQRHALTVRDRGCVFPGCDRPPGWCHAHHIKHWANDGPSDLDNLALLCSHHHHLVHEGHFGLERDHHGDPVFTRPNGTRINPPQHHQAA
jgi:hypothetical protein